MLAGTSDAIFPSKGLERWLDSTLQRLSGLETSPSFAELYEATEIDLFVVTMDLATGDPLVLSRFTSPTSNVSRSVVASCSIPLAFEGGRALIRGAAGLSVHRLVDGGAWANYPQFVFRDLSFGSWLIDSQPIHERQAVATAVEEMRSRPFVGFVLGGSSGYGTPNVISLLSRKDGVTDRYDLGVLKTSRGLLGYLLAKVIGSRSARLLLFIAAILWTVGELSTVSETSISFLSSGSSAPSTVRVALSLLAPLAILFFILVIGLVSAAVLGLGRPLTQTVMPAGRAALGVATGVPPWAGRGTGDQVLVVNFGVVETTEFNLSEEKQQAVICSGRESVAAQLNHQPPTTDPRPQLHPGPGSEVGETDDVDPLARLLALIGTAVPLAISSYFLLNQDLGLAILFLLFAAFFGVPILSAAHNRTRALALIDESQISRTDSRWALTKPLVQVLSGLLLLVWSAVEATDRVAERESETFVATVIEAKAGGAQSQWDYDYVLRISDGTHGELREIDFAENLRLRVGDSISIRRVPDDTGGYWDLAVTTPGDYLLPYAGTLVGLALGTIGLQSLSKRRRVRRLASVWEG